MYRRSLVFRIPLLLLIVLLILGVAVVGASSSSPFPLSYTFDNGSLSSASVPPSGIGTGQQPHLAHRSTANGIAERVRVDTERSDGAFPSEHHAGSQRTDPLYASTSSDSNIRVTNELHHLPDEPGIIEVRMKFQIPGHVTRLETTLPRQSSVTDTDGFISLAGGTYGWDGRTSSPSITFRHAVNMTLESEGPLEGDGDYLFVDTGEWALIQIPTAGLSWSWRDGERARVVRTTEIAGPGAAGTHVAFLGDIDEHTHVAHGQRFRLIIPASAGMAESPSEIFESVSHASDTLRVGSRDPEVFMVAAPTDDVAWAVRGLQIGPADMWVRDVERLDSADNVWVHEYVHSRQGYTAASDMRWFTEATATYYAAYLTLEEGRIDFDEFAATLRRGSALPQSHSRLATPSTWQNNADYYKGSLVAGELDRQIRLSSSFEQSLASVFQRMNAHDGVVDGVAVRGYIEDTAGRDVRRSAHRYTTTSDAPRMWDQRAHDEAFGQVPARIGYSIDSDGLRVTGEFRDQQVTPHASLDIMHGESLTIPIRVENAGGSAGEYDLSLVVDGSVKESRIGRLSAGDSTIEVFTHTFDTPGTSSISIEDQRFLVTVHEPAVLSITDLRIDRTAIEPGNSVSITATVINPDQTKFGKQIVTIRIDGEPYSEQTIRLEPGGAHSIRETILFDEPGTFTIAVGSELVTVTVSAPIAERSPGFGVPVTLSIILFVVLYRRFR